MKAININDKEYPFTDMILNGYKKIETRHTKSLHSLIGQRVGIIRTGCGKAMLVGFVDIIGVKEYKSVGEFRKDYIKHRVEPGSKYDIAHDGIKYGYMLKDPRRCKPVLVTSRGIVIRNI